MKYSANSILSRTDQFVETEIDGEIALMNHESGKFFTLAGTAVRSWQLIQNDVQLADIVATLCEEHDVEPSKCLEDLQSWLADLEKGGLIEIR